MKRIDDPSRNWKFSSADVKERQFWNQYMEAYGEMLSNTSTFIAPWYVIPADNKWFMLWAVSSILLEKLNDLPLNFPNLPANEQQRLADAKDMLLQEE